jgi:hypothetical protein
MMTAFQFSVIAIILLLFICSFFTGRYGALALSSAAAGAAAAGLVVAFAGPINGGWIAVWVGLALGALARAAFCWLWLVMDDFGRGLSWALGRSGRPDAD